MSTSPKAGIALIFSWLFITNSLSPSHSKLHRTHVNLNEE